MTRYNMNDRPTPGGSMEPRLNPKTRPELNAKLGPPTWPKPLVRQTSSGGAIPESRKEARRSVIGLPSRFDRS
jgi:hypothetical protein